MKKIFRGLLSGWGEGNFDNMTDKIITAKLTKWGSSLALRIPPSIVRKLDLRNGALVKLEVQIDIIVVKPIDKCKLTLEERLELFDPKIHT